MPNPVLNIGRVERHQLRRRPLLCRVRIAVQVDLRCQLFYLQHVLLLRSQLAEAEESILAKQIRRFLRGWYYYECESVHNFSQK